MIKMVALDLDGTIVNEHLKISPKVLSVLSHLILHTDVKVVIATGRMFMSALPFAREIGIREPIVAYQGAMIRDLNDGQTIRSHTPLQMELAKELLHMLIEQKFHVNVYMNDDLWTHPDNIHAAQYMRTAGVQPIYTEDLIGCLNMAPTKLMVIDDHRVDTLLEYLSQNFVERVSYCRSRTNFCELIDISASKWNALKHLADEYGILPEEIMAIGDQGNDVSMITHAGVGIAMGNAPDEVKAIANYVTTSIDQDGAAEAIEKFVLGGMPLETVR